MSYAVAREPIELRTVYPAVGLDLGTVPFGRAVVEHAHNDVGIFSRQNSLGAQKRRSIDFVRTAYLSDALVRN